MFLNFKGAVMSTLREYIDKNMRTNKIVAFHYYDKQRCAVSDIIGLVNQPFLARDAYIAFFSINLCLLSLTAFLIFCLM